MNITRENIDELNAVVKVEIKKDDYQPKVEKILKDYRKSANIPGFRKGHVPMGLVKKQYGKAVLVDEVNKLLQESLNNYLNEEKLEVLGNPLPKAQDNFDWDKEDYAFEFELGLAPKFDVNLKTKDKVTHYKIVANEEMIDNQVKTIQKQYGKLVSKNEVEEGDLIAGTFKSEDGEIENTTTLPVEKIKGKRNTAKFIGAKVGDQLSLKSKNLFENTEDLTEFLGIDAETAEDLDVDLSFEITEVNKQEPAELDQELFDKLFGKDQVKSVTELKEKIKEDAENQFEQQSDQQLLNDVTEKLIEETKFELPGEFLQKWIMTSGEKELSAEEAKEEYEKSEKGIRFQLIEAKIINDNDLKVELEEIKDLTKNRIKMQMAQFGQMNPSDKDLEDITARVLANQDEVKKLSEQVLNKKLLDTYKEKANLEEKELSYEDFVKEVYN